MKKNWNKPTVEELAIKLTAKNFGLVDTEPGGVCPVCGKKWTGNPNESAHKGWCTYPTSQNS